MVVWCERFEQQRLDKLIVIIIKVKMGSLFNLEDKYGIMDEQEDSLGSISSASSNGSDLIDDANSSHSSSSSSSDHKAGPLYEMSSIMQNLPIKRGLSKHYQGKSQSFTSLSNVISLEDLPKPENPCNKKLKSCKSYGGLVGGHESQKFSPPKSRISKNKQARGGSCSYSSLNSTKRNNSFMGNRPPVPPQRTSSLCNQTPLFA